MTAISNFVPLGEKMHELLVKNGKKRKRKEEMYCSHDCKIGGKFSCCVTVFLWKLNESCQSWSKVSTSQHSPNEGAQLFL